MRIMLCANGMRAVLHMARGWRCLHRRAPAPLRPQLAHAARYDWWLITRAALQCERTRTPRGGRARCTAGLPQRPRPPESNRACSCKPAQVYRNGTCPVNSHCLVSISTSRALRGPSLAVLRCLVVHGVSHACVIDALDRDRDAFPAGRHPQRSKRRPLKTQSQATVRERNVKRPSQLIVSLACCYHANRKPVDDCSPVTHFW
jgi:hypothetical protein